MKYVKLFEDHAILEFHGGNFSEEEMISFADYVGKYYANPKNKVLATKDLLSQWKKNPSAEKSDKKDISKEDIDKFLSKHGYDEKSYTPQEWKRIVDDAKLNAYFQ
jgi:hypothetical protein